MTTISKDEAKQALDTLMEQNAADHQTVLITGETHNSVVVAEEDWNALQETLYLFSIPGMRESIEEGLHSDLKDCTTNPGW